MRAAPRLDRYGGRTFRAILCHRLGMLRLFQPINRAHQQENRAGDDQKIDQQGDKVAVVPGDRASLDRVSGRVKRNRAVFCPAQDDELVRKIQTATEQANRRHDDVFDQRINDSAEGCADNYADGQIDRVAFDGEFLELLPTGFDPVHTTMLTSFFGTITTLRTGRPSIRRAIFGLESTAALTSSSRAKIDLLMHARTHTSACTT